MSLEAYINKKLCGKKFFVLLIFSFLLIVSQVIAGTDYYIDSSNGNDQNNGISPETTWKTIGKANSTLQPGDTVYIRKGTYIETIAPANSGTAGNYITYSNYNNEEAVITGVADGVDLTNRHYIVIDGIKITNTVHSWVTMYGTAPSTHNIIKNCYMDEVTSGWAGILMGGGTVGEGHSDYNRILNNTFIGRCHPENLVQCSYGASYNLFEGNDFQYGPHGSIEFTGAGRQVTHNIVRNNTIENLWHTGINFYVNADMNLIDGNIIVDCGEDHENNWCGSERDRTNPRHIHSAIQIGASKIIVRNNVLINNGAFVIESNGNPGIWSPRSLNNIVYNNTFYQNHRAIESVCDKTLTDNVFKNNIFYNNFDFEIHWWVEGSPTDNFFVNNNILGSLLRYYPVKDEPLSYLQTNYPTFWYDNTEVNPMFVDESNRNLDLRSNSPMIDTGAFLAKTTSSGNGTNIFVDDARYFMDGWGIIEGDLIQLEGQSQTARIVVVDYDNNIITVDVPLTWDSDQGVSLAYSGFTPDIGANECVKPLYIKINASPISGHVPLAVNFIGKVVGDYPPYSYTWNFGDGESSNEQNPSHDYYQAGDFTATLTVTDNIGNQESISFAIRAIVPTYDLTISSTTDYPASDNGGSTDPSSGNHSYTNGNPIQIKAIPYENYRFSRWTGDVSGSNACKQAITITMDNNKSITAHFCSKCGDINGDLKITPSDAQATFDIFLGKISNPTTYQKENADVNCDGTKTEPKVTPSDAQAIFNKFLGTEELPCDCSGDSKTDILTSQIRTSSDINLIINDLSTNLGEEIVVPIIIDNPLNIDAFGFDLIFPSEILEFIGIERTELLKNFNQVDAYKIAEGMLRVGGYGSKPKMAHSPKVLITLIFRVIGEGNKPSRFLITNTLDDLKNASVNTGMLTKKKEIKKRFLKKQNKKQKPFLLSI